MSTRNGTRLRRGSRLIIAGVIVVVAVSLVEIASAFGHVTFSRTAGNASWALHFRGGLISVQQVNSPIYRNRPALRMQRVAPPALVLWPNGGLYASVGNQGLAIRMWSLPLWVGLIPGIGLIALGARRRCRRQAGTCPSCGYDLKGTTPGPCPECGS